MSRVRARTLELVAPITDAGLARQHSPLMSPIVWDLCHVAEFEHLWLVRRHDEGAGAGLPAIFDASRTPRSERSSLELPARREALAALESIRGQALRALETARFEDADPLLEGGYVYELVLGHEAQHQETVLQTIQLIGGETYVPVVRRELPHPAPTSPAMLPVPGGRFRMGAGTEGFAYDNERPAHERQVAAFEIGRYPVSNGEYAEFMAAGGYLDSRLWSEAGRRWLAEAAVGAPLFWVEAEPGAASDGGHPPDPGAGGELPHPVAPSARAAAALTREEGLDGWRRRTALGEEEIAPYRPVIHVCFHEAEAYARFRGARLPSESEWEMAAGWEPDTGAMRPRPWGEAEPTPELANLDQLGFGVAPLGAYPAGRSPVGCEQMLGDVWEWTSAPFHGYAGFRAFPYPEYSEVFFGEEYRVLRGGSWATLPELARNSFRNWDFPIRRQIMAGIRLARTP